MADVTLEAFDAVLAELGYAYGSDLSPGHWRCMPEGRWIHLKNGRSVRAVWLGWDALPATVASQPGPLYIGEYGQPRTRINSVDELRQWLVEHEKTPTPVETLREAVDLAGSAIDTVTMLNRRLERADEIVRKAANLVQALVFAVDAADEAFASALHSIRRGEALALLRDVKRRGLSLGAALVAFDRDT